MKPKTMTFHEYDDPGHGWLKVPKKLIQMLEIADEISSGSYQRGNYAFLEEDYDATIFLRALTQHGIEWKIKTHTANRRSKIRSYDRLKSIRTHQNPDGTWYIPNIHESLAQDVKTGLLTIRQAAGELNKAGWHPYVDVERTKRDLAKYLNP